MGNGSQTSLPGIYDGRIFEEDGYVPRGPFFDRIVSVRENIRLITAVLCIFLYPSDIQRGLRHLVLQEGQERSAEFFPERYFVFVRTSNLISFVAITN